MNKEKEFLTLLEQHKGILYKISRMYEDNEEEQEELRQEIVYQLWSSYQSFEGKSKFSTWMYRVALNTVLTQFKKGNRKAQVETQLNEEAYEVKSDGSDALEKENQLNYFYKAVQELNKVEKALIFLYLEGLPHREIAANLGISEGNARVKLNRTISKLQKIVIQKGYE
ncbi:MAG TPA: sigma-70 family RNA polymerase sigma factor [Bacteroidales bacterium]|jgi:RNA polymerase sigma factor (sigma-70 family)|nr:sigma-70 family RNA polymerase sigma factor [Bacteroidales bacterium]HHT52636.1 sigma-70 family RNA polymerase sigma factor [Bacteroidales bacterium]HNY62222.1 sigma-70 family RNA polymerase sigma factor [Bacteroidales bacterium]HOH22580.1 sigma-70 family RNA polymerase sigma factor [Bacteroidales bacterium]HPB58187.1 sigma-70 family RNA polymerase sigma factor [Bacteroidales bacterium]